jgi:hypothetical protein
MSEHSPGPWHWEDGGSHEEGDAGRLCDAKGSVVLDGFGEGVTQSVDVGPEDARLIAAAPELLKQLKLCLKAFEDNWCIDWGEVDGLIRHIEGEP